MAVAASKENLEATNRALDRVSGSLETLSGGDGGGLSGTLSVPALAGAEDDLVRWLFMMTQRPAALHA